MPPGEEVDFTLDRPHRAPPMWKNMLTSPDIRSMMSKDDKVKTGENRRRGTSA